MVPTSLLSSFPAKGTHYWLIGQVSTVTGECDSVGILNQYKPALLAKEVLPALNSLPCLCLHAGAMHWVQGWPSTASSVRQSHGFSQQFLPEHKWEARSWRRGLHRSSEQSDWYSGVNGSDISRNSLGRNRSFWCICMSKMFPGTVGNQMVLAMNNSH